VLVKTNVQVGLTGVLGGGSLRLALALSQTGVYSKQAHSVHSVLLFPT